MKKSGLNGCVHFSLVWTLSIQPVNTLTRAFDVGTENPSAFAPFLLGMQNNVPESLLTHRRPIVMLRKEKRE